MVLSWFWADLGASVSELSLKWNLLTYDEYGLHSSPGKGNIFGMMLHKDVYDVGVVVNLGNSSLEPFPRTRKLALVRVLGQRIAY